MTCARYLEETFDKWLLSEGAVTYKDLRDLILMEHFTNLADKDIGTKIREKRFTVLKEAATWSDDRVLALRGSDPKSGGGIPFGRESPAGGSAFANKTPNQFTTDREGENLTGHKRLTSNPKVTCFYCKQGGRIKSNYCAI